MQYSRNDSRPELKALTGIRAIAAWFIFFHHEGTRLPVNESPLLNRLAAEMHVGVTLFFVLSGFVITYQYQDRLSYSWSGFSEFVRRRFFRIFPTYWLVCFMAIAVDFARGGPTNGFIYWAFQFTLLKAFFEQAKFSGIAQSWSLAIEECFYWIAPVLFWFRGAKIFLALLGIYLIGAFIGYLSIEGVWPEEMRSIGFMFPIPFIIIYTFFGRAFEFICGIILARIILGPHGSLAQRLKLPFTFLGALLSIILFGVLVSMQGRNIALISPVGATINNLLMPIGFAILFYGLIIERTLFSRLLSTRFFRELGRASYCFYLINHGEVADFLSSSLGDLGIISKFIVLNLFAVALHQLFEVRVVSRLRKRKALAF